MRVTMDDNNQQQRQASTMMFHNEPAKSSQQQRKNHPKRKLVLEPTELDILCGKDKSSIIHPGTRRYRTYIEAYQDRYSQCTKKDDKMEVTKEIVTKLSRTGRFLRYNQQIECYEELTHLEARDKTSHALRQGLKQRSKQKHKETETPDAIESSRVLVAGAERESGTETSRNRGTMRGTSSRYQLQPSRTTDEPLEPHPLHPGRVEEGAFTDDMLSLLKGYVLEE